MISITPRETWAANPEKPVDKKKNSFSDRFKKVGRNLGGRRSNYADNGTEPIS
jgi:hypothetical protein